MFLSRSKVQLKPSQHSVLTLMSCRSRANFSMRNLCSTSQRQHVLLAFLKKSKKHLVCISIYSIYFSWRLSGSDISQI